MNTIDCFMDLLSAGINKIEYRIKELPTKEEWDALYKYSIQQNIVGIIYEQLVFSGVFNLAQEAAAKKDVQETESVLAALRFREMFRERAMESALRQVRQTKLFYEYYEEILKAGVRPIVVKGIVCRNTYPNPDLRPSSDEDFYVPERDCLKLKDCLLAQGFRLTEASAEKEKMEELAFVNPAQGILYEVHTTLMPRGSSFYEQYDAAFEGAFEKAKAVEIEGHTVYTLEETQHLFFLFSHLLKHFVAGGVGVRQLCDMLMFIRKYHEKIDWKTFRGWLDRYHLDVFWTNLMDIGVRRLAFDPERYGVPVNKKIRPDSEKILEDMFEAGVYGAASAARKHSANLTIKAAENENTDTAGGILRSLFPSFEFMQVSYPYLRKKRYLLPVAYGQRIVNFLKNKDEQKDESGKSVVALGRERIRMLKKYGIIK